MPKPNLLARARSAGSPLINGRTATFIWEGERPAHLISDLHDWEEHPQPLKKSGRDVWSLSLELPMDAYVEYAFYDLDTRQRLADPLNRRRRFNGFNAYNNYFYMPEGSPTPLLAQEQGIKHGQVSRHVVETDGMAAGSERTVYLYRPPGRGPFPLLVVYDGPDYLRQSKIAAIVDNLIAQKRIRPLAMALPQHGGQARTLEYGCAELTLGFVAEKVIGLAREHIKLLDPGKRPGAYGVMGSSMGGLMALYTGLRLPDLFGRVLSQSGAFRFPEHEFVTGSLVRSLPPPAGLRIWMDVGRFEWLLDCNREMAALLSDRNYDVSYNEFNGGHNHVCWRNSFWRGLQHLFPLE